MTGAFLHKKYCLMGVPGLKKVQAGIILRHFPALALVSVFLQSCPCSSQVFPDIEIMTSRLTMINQA